MDGTLIGIGAVMVLLASFMAVTVMPKNADIVLLAVSGGLLVGLGVGSVARGRWDAKRERSS